MRVDLDRGEELTGSIELADGSAAAGATVAMRDQTGIMKRTQADASGRYRLQGLLPGTYSFSVRVDRARSLPNQQPRSAPVQLQIEEGENRYDHRMPEAAAEAR